jgi:hypothetical protein
MANYNTSKGYYKDYPKRKRYHESKNDWPCEEQARKCNQCGEPTVVTYNLRTYQVDTFELDVRYPNRRRKHRHQADNITKASVISSIAVEKRNLFERRSGDYDPVSRRIIK